MSEYTLLFGVGAQKSGTSWLHRYLSSHPECHFSSVKEMHYFDSLEIENQTRLEKVRGRAKNMRRRRKEMALWDRRGITRRIRDAEDWLKIFDGHTPVHDKYIRYLTKRRGKAKVVGDITPEYAIVSDTTLAEMVAIVPKTKFVFLMRDPFDRTWSAIRMKADRATDVVDDFSQDANKRMDNFLEGRSPGLAGLSDYASTLKRLAKYVPPEDIHLQFYETLFTDEAVQRLTDFIGIAPKPAPTEKVVFQGKSLLLDDHRRQQALKLLLPQYQFVSDHFSGDIPDRWKQNMADALR